MKLNISDELKLPIEAVTQTFAVLAKRGVGKSYTASVMAEEMLKAGQQIVAVDPTGAWWGLRSKFPIVVMGGEHGDVPLEESAGEVIAQAVVDNRFPAVIDLSLFRKGQMIRFMTAFAETLYRLNREAVHLFVDEADAVAPQARNYGGDENRMLGAMEDIVRRGRKRGIGCTLITQRPAVLNKNVLTQCEILVALRMVHPKDIDAIKEWVAVHGDPELAKQMIGSLPSLPVGTAWFWAPGWGDIFEKVRIRERETFDSGATPKPGESERKPKHLAAIDIDQLGQQIKATVEKAKENDPRELRRQIAELKKQLAARPTETKEKVVEKIIEVPVLKNGQLDRTEKAQERLEKYGQRLLEEAAELRRLIAPAAAPRPVASPIAAPPRAVYAAALRPSPRPAKAAVAVTEGELTAPERAILDTVLMLEARGIEASRDTVARWLAIHPNGGRYGSNLARLRSEGYLDNFTLTDLGRQTARELPTGITAALQALADEGKRRIINTLLEVGKPQSRDELAAMMGIHPNGGRYGSDLSWLRTMGVITQRGLIAPTEGLSR